MILVLNCGSQSIKWKVFSEKIAQIKAGDVKIGDVIVFQSRKPYPIIHRVIRKDEKGLWVFQTKGDIYPHITQEALTAACAEGLLMEELKLRFEAGRDALETRIRAWNIPWRSPRVQ